jgi:ATP-binding cassette, subfamily C (CFTR/MRP), member 1
LRMYAEFENLMTCSQRCVQYTELEAEDDPIKANDKELTAKQWPQSGEIELKNAVMRYRPTLEPSIKNLSFKAQAGMKVGIVGRTGAGKSSILQTLFRLIDLSAGQQIIDGEDLTTVGLHVLRSNIAYIP